MLDMTFDKQRAEQLVDSFRTGKPIEPSCPGLWTHDDLAQLAGACWIRLQEMRGMPHYLKRQREPVHAEYAEAEFETICDDAWGAMYAAGAMTACLIAGNFDHYCNKPVVTYRVIGPAGYAMQFNEGDGFKRPLPKNRR